LHPRKSCGHVKQRCRIHRAGPLREGETKAKVHAGQERCEALHNGARQPHSTAQHSTAQHSTAQHSTAQHSTAQHSTVQYNTTQHSTTQNSATRHNTVQHNTTQPSTSQNATPGEDSSGDTVRHAPAHAARSTRGQHAGGYEWLPETWRGTCPPAVFG